MVFEKVIEFFQFRILELAAEVTRIEEKLHG